MLRKSTASGFACAMIVLIAMRVPVLGFCLCQHQVVLDPASCCEHTSLEQTGCGCCPAESEASKPEPCSDDCVVVLSLDAGEFTWSADRFSPSDPSATPIALPSGFHEESLPAAPWREAAGTIRGSPPRGEPAVLLRTQVLRL